LQALDPYDATLEKEGLKFRDGSERATPMGSDSIAVPMAISQRCGAWTESHGSQGLVRQL
jgi:hypothetical protein